MLRCRIGEQLRARHLHVTRTGLEVCDGRDFTGGCRASLTASPASICCQNDSHRLGEAQLCQSRSELALA